MQQDMKKHMMTTSRAAHTALALAMGTLLALPALAQNLTVTPGQKATAEQVAQAGIPLSELAANAPDNYTVKRGDTLWAISRLFLKSPWRWPELWGMNLNDIKNPHLIYPGQKLFLEKKDGRATLRTNPSAATEMPTDTVKLSPRTRYESLGDGALPTIQFNLIEPFLAEPIIVDENGLRAAPRIVAAAQEGRVLLTRGDRAYARGPGDAPLLDDQKKEKQFRVFRNATPLKDPGTGEVLGYEAQYVGSATLVRSESTQAGLDKDGKTTTEVVPATIDIVGAKEEMRVGDRLLPEPERQFQNFAPSAPKGSVDGRIVSVYGSAVVNASQNQVVVINRGSKDGMQNGHVMAILKDGQRMVDKTDETKPLLKLPDERNGLLMVFRTFEKLSYALVLEITEGVRVGDRLASPR
ncbi:MAG: hypothetical protein RIS34_1996 [Pseudomonadota bacterium]|jgi:LysM repeat protein